MPLVKLRVGRGVPSSKYSFAFPDARTLQSFVFVTASIAVARATTLRIFTLVVTRKRWLVRAGTRHASTRDAVRSSLQPSAASTSAKRPAKRGKLLLNSAPRRRVDNYDLLRWKSCRAFTVFLARDCLEVRFMACCLPQKMKLNFRAAHIPQGRWNHPSQLSDVPVNSALRTLRSPASSEGDDELILHAYEEANPQVVQPHEHGITCFSGKRWRMVIYLQKRRRSGALQNAIIEASASGRTDRWRRVSQTHSQSALPYDDPPVAGRSSVSLSCCILCTGPFAVRRQGILRQACCTTKPKILALI